MLNKILNFIKRGGGVLVVIAVILIFFGGAFLIYREVVSGDKAGGGNKAASQNKADKETGIIKSGASPQAIAEISAYQYTQTYEHAANKFSFKYPEDFTVSSITNDDESEVILVQNIAKNIGVQILISSFKGDDIDVTAETIKADLPDLKISDPQTVEIGDNRKGLAFMSDSKEFGGQSREVWFVFRGSLYQISTYAELDGFLKGLFGTWQFK
jgi:hypothetical protein